MTENRSVVVCGWGKGVGWQSWMTRGYKETYGRDEYVISS